jgi:pyruvate/2-oxoacid:ferredoxin oxidoreductase beta subunit
MLSPCPTGWKSDPSQGTELVRAAVRSGLFPLFEVFDGTRYRINERPDGLAIEEYMKHQRRYRAASVDPSALKARIEQQWQILNAMAEMFPADQGE